jgi:hypothetical protein
MESEPGPAHALVIGPPTVQAPLEPLFSRSHWALEREADLQSALQRLSKERFPVVFCHAEDWKRIARSMANLDRAPMVIALASEEPGKKDWIEAISHNVYSLNVNRLAPSKLFPLLNHAWRTSNP